MNIHNILAKAKTPSRVVHTCGTATWEEGPKDSPILGGFNQAYSLRNNAKLVNIGNNVYQLLDKDNNLIEVIVA